MRSDLSYLVLCYLHERTPLRLAGVCRGAQIHRLSSKQVDTSTQSTGYMKRWNGFLGSVGHHLFQLYDLSGRVLETMLPFLVRREEERHKMRSNSSECLEQPYDSCARRLELEI